MGVKAKIKKILKIFQYEVKTPVYIPVTHGEILKNKTILITGGTGGIGYAIAEVSLRNGANVIISGRNQEKLEDVKTQLITVTGCETKRIKLLVMDISKVDTIGDKVREAVMLADEKIDILVNNAGVQKGTALGTTKEEDYDIVLDTNLKGTYYMTQEFSNYLIRQGIQGNILNISSVSGIRPAITPYMISKWGVTGLTKGLAKKLIKHNIVVNGIAPGPVATEMLSKDGSNLMYEGAPAKRYADAMEIANLAVFLISDMARMIVGETVYITGGCGTLTVDDIKY